ncbi:hypothetical protein [Liquorilactobacillus oeni]|uniref:Bacterial Pleckstrin homology domain-containing protein n=1 Tax=Liquorilactobacillus oeni DSM 19972 TaxID=1423777 RepID=A0A0R1M9V3_9LACO|nr:hypothetical protein [Liquorilactobacillus oeni]KRL05117.1 hypothetical protein FD46_GL001062 [Liquorilactobacillus oeni DSM 19972]
MENKVQITAEKLIVVPQGINKLASLKRRLEFALINVMGASIDEGILNERKGIKAPGTAMPGYWSGTFTKNGEKTFFNIKRPNKPVVVQLKNESYSRLVLGVQNPSKLVDDINNSI